jgi:acyl carrier protein
MTQQECREKLKQNIVDTLHLEGVSVDDITDDMILFTEDGLGLD